MWELLRDEADRILSLQAPLAVSLQQSKGTNPGQLKIRNKGVAAVKAVQLCATRGHKGLGNVLLQLRTQHVHTQNFTLHIEVKVKSNMCFLRRRGDNKEKAICCKNMFSL